MAANQVNVVATYPPIISQYPLTSTAIQSWIVNAPSGGGPVVIEPTYPVAPHHFVKVIIRPLDANLHTIPPLPAAWKVPAPTYTIGGGLPVSRGAEIVCVGTWDYNRDSTQIMNRARTAYVTFKSGVTLEIPKRYLHECPRSPGIATTTAPTQYIPGIFPLAVIPVH